MDTETTPQNPWPALQEEYLPPPQMSPDEPGVPGVSPEPLVDIIAVQGLASTYPQTWTHWETGVMWLRELLPGDFPGARILSFRYDSKWLDDPAQVSLIDCAKRLLQSILWDRSHHGDTEMCKAKKRRPLLLIGHSFGGLVIKQALVLASRRANRHHGNTTDYDSILKSTSGIIFLGTPHKGSRLAKYGSYKARLRGLFGAPNNIGLLKPLMIDSDTHELDNLHEEFSGIRDWNILKDLEVLYFWETKSMSVMGVKLPVVVDKDSACWGATPGCSVCLEANHSEMNKFGHKDDENYKLVRQGIESIYKSAGRVVEQRWGADKYDHRYASSELRELRNWLLPCFLARRVEELQSNRHSGTCTWAIQNPSVSTWMDPESRLPIQNLWIHGKPGSGKSVLSAFLYEQLEGIVSTHQLSGAGDIHCSGNGGSGSCISGQISDPWAVSYFSFQGTEDVIRVISTLIHQLLKQQAGNVRLLKIATEFHNQSSELSPNIAMKLLLRILQIFSLAYIIIDGIDECDGREELIIHLEQLSKIDHVRLLLLSRADLVIQRSIIQNLCTKDMIIDMATNNGTDIQSFIQQQVDLLARGSPILLSLQDKILHKLKQNSLGMFQWVKLIIDALRYHGTTEKDVLETLEHFPPELENAYRKTLNRLSNMPSFKKNRASLVLKWLVTAMRPLTLNELAVAIGIQEQLAQDYTKTSASPPGNVLDKSISDLGGAVDEMLQKHFTELLGPLVEFHQTAPGHKTSDRKGNILDDYENQENRSPCTTIRICHHSLTQLLTENPSGILDDDIPRSSGSRSFFFKESSAHESAAKACIQAMCSTGSYLSYLRLYYDPDGLLDEYPFLGYACENWSRHLRASGSPLDPSEDIVGWLGQLVLVNTVSAFFVLAGLSKLFSYLDLGKIGQTAEAIAFRDAQTSVLPAIEALAGAANCIPDLVNALRRINPQVGGRIGVKPKVQKVSFHVKDIGDSTALVLDELLDSSLVNEARLILDSRCEIQEPTLQGLEYLRDASRKLRGLTLTLSVDPVRSWLYQRTSGGLSPIVALSHMTHSLDMFICLPVLPFLEHDINHVKDQFSCDSKHPLYGPAISAQMELEAPQSHVLTAEFYKNHIIHHHRPALGEFVSIKFMLDVLETSVDPRNRPYLRQWLYSWIAHSMKLSPGPDCEYMEPSVSFSRLEPRSIGSDFIKTTEFLQWIPRLFWVVVIKCLMIICPATEDLLLSIHFEVETRIKGPRLSLANLFTDLPSTGSGILLYGIRWRLVPFLFATIRNSPWIDLKDILRDPFNHQTRKLERGWMVITLLVAQDALVVAFLAYRAFMNEKEPTPIPPNEAIENEIHNRARFRWSIIRRPLTKALWRFVDLISLERAFYNISYIAYDLLAVTIRVINPSLWSPSLMIQTTSSIVTQILLKQIGLYGVVVLLLKIWALGAVWRVLGLTRVIRVALRMCDTPARSAFTTVAHIFAPVRLFFLHINHSTLVPLCALGIGLAIFAFYRLAMSDPLQLKAAKRSCSVAYETTLRVMQLTEPENIEVNMLGWPAPSSDMAVPPALKSDSVGKIDPEINGEGGHSGELGRHQARSTSIGQGLHTGGDKSGGFLRRRFGIVDIFKRKKE